MPAFVIADTFAGTAETPVSNRPPTTNALGGHWGSVSSVPGWVCRAGPKSFNYAQGNYARLELSGIAADDVGGLTSFDATLTLDITGATAYGSMFGGLSFNHKNGTTTSCSIGDDAGVIKAVWYAGDMNIGITAVSPTGPYVLSLKWDGTTITLKVNGTTVGTKLASGPDYLVPFGGVAKDVVQVVMQGGNTTLSAFSLSANYANDIPVPPEPEPDARTNMLIKDVLSVSYEQLHMVPGTPAKPAQKGYYSYERQNYCSWVYPGNGHYVWVTDRQTGVTRGIWVPDIFGGGQRAIWKCVDQVVPVWHEPTPAYPATPPTYYSANVTESSFNLGWNSGARSIKIFKSDASVQFQVGASAVGVIVGMNIDDGTPVTFNGNTIDYGFYCARGSARVMKNGAMGAIVGAYNDETIFRIERVGTTVTWKMGTSPVHTVTGALTGAGWLEAAMYSGNDYIFNPLIEQVSPPDLTTKNATIAGNLPLLGGGMTQGPHCEINGNLPALEGLLTTGLITPSYCVVGGEISIFSGNFAVLTGEMATISGSLPPMTGILADHPYAVIAGALPPVDGILEATEGNNKASFNGWLRMADTLVTRTFLVATIQSNLTISGVITVDVSATAELFSTVRMDDLWTFTSMQKALLWSYAQTTDVVGAPQGDVQTWVVCLDSPVFGTTEYSNYDFNSYAKVGDFYYGAGAGGIVRLDGDTDDGDPIRSILSFGKLDADKSVKKTWQQCYLGMGAQGHLFVKIIAEGREFIYRTRDYSPELQQQRVTFGKGLRTNYVTLEVYNEDGTDFELDTVEFVIADLSRKI